MIDDLDKIPNAEEYWDVKGCTKAMENRVLNPNPQGFCDTYLCTGGHCGDRVILKLKNPSNPKEPYIKICFDHKNYE